VLLCHCRVLAYQFGIYALLVLAHHLHAFCVRKQRGHIFFSQNRTRLSR
jgi:hypothetical protein